MGSISILFTKLSSNGNKSREINLAELGFEPGAAGYKGINCAMRPPPHQSLGGIDQWGSWSVLRRPQQAFSFIGIPPTRIYLRRRPDGAELLTWCRWLVATFKLEGIIVLRHHLWNFYLITRVRRGSRVYWGAVVVPGSVPSLWILKNFFTVYLF